MNRLELRELTLRLSIADRLLLLWDIVRSVFGGRSAEPSQIVPSKEAAIARIETLVDRLSDIQPNIKINSANNLKVQVMARVNILLNHTPELWQSILEEPEAEVLHKVKLWLAIEQLADCFSEISEEDMAEFENIAEGR